MISSLKIVHCANFSESKYANTYYSIDRKLSNGLVRNGHFVYDFSYREIAKNATFFRSKKLGTKKANLALLETLKNIEPDLLMLGHSELITLETLKQAKKLYPKMKIGMWWVDPFENITHIPERLSIIDIFFSTTGNSYVRQLFGKDTHAKLFFFPNTCDVSIEHAMYYKEKSYDYDLIYVGREDDRRKKIIHYIKSLKDISLGIFGNNRENLLFGHLYYKTLKASKIALNYSRFNDIELYSSDRIIQLAASGIMVLSPKIPHFTTLFNENEVVYFHNQEDFKEKLEYYLSHDDERQTIATNGYLKALKSFNSTRVTKFMIEALYDLPFSETYEWTYDHSKN